MDYINVKMLPRKYALLKQKQNKNLKIQYSPAHVSYTIHNTCNQNHIQSIFHSPQKKWKRRNKKKETHREKSYLYLCTLIFSSISNEIISKDKCVQNC